MNLHLVFSLSCTKQVSQIPRARAARALRQGSEAAVEQRDLAGEPAPLRFSLSFYPRFPLSHHPLFSLSNRTQQLHHNNGAALVEHGSSGSLLRRRRVLPVLPLAAFPDLVFAWCWRTVEEDHLPHWPPLDARSRRLRRVQQWSRLTRRLEQQLERTQCLPIGPVRRPSGRHQRTGEASSSTPQRQHWAAAASCPG